MKRAFLLVIALVGCLAASGCKKTPPPIVEAKGRITLNGKPLARASVQFIPELKDFGAEFNSSALTDEKGEFTLTCATNNQPGAVVATHRVLVTEYTPDNARGMDAQSQERQAKHYASLTNRPIPEEYGNFTTTPLRVTVEQGKSTYEVELKR